MRVAVHNEQGIKVYERDADFDAPPNILTLHDELYDLAGIQDAVAHYVPRDKR